MHHYCILLCILCMYFGSMTRVYAFLSPISSQPQHAQWCLTAAAKQSVGCNVDARKSCNINCASHSHKVFPASTSSMTWKFRMAHRSAMGKEEISTEEADPVKDFLASQRSSIWKSRRSIAKALLSFCEQFKDSSPDQSAKDVEKSEKKLFGADENTVLSIFTVVAFSLVLRLGGRYSLLSMLGLDLTTQSPLYQNLISVLHFLNEDLSSSSQLLALFVAWFVAKALCIDFLTIVLAILSGVLYANVSDNELVSIVYGTSVSVVCATLASSLIFLGTRYLFADKVQQVTTTDIA